MTLLLFFYLPPLPVPHVRDAERYFTQPSTLPSHSPSCPHFLSQFSLILQYPSSHTHTSCWLPPQQHTEVVAADLVCFISAHENPVLVTGVLLEDPDITHTTFLPLRRIKIKVHPKQFCSPAKRSHFLTNTKCTAIDMEVEIVWLLSILLSLRVSHGSAHYLKALTFWILPFRPLPKFLLLLDPDWWLAQNEYLDFRHHPKGIAYTAVNMGKQIEAAHSSLLADL